ncbi:MAG: ribosome biogenesis GTP-binding protein YihA/YsxC [Brumimicrobium sp.]
MIIKSAQFVISNTDIDKCPAPNMPEYAFIGRSNVGKSSLINAMTNNKNLAKTSGRPGKTQLINHFLINKEWYLVDLPGYGYAKSSKSDRRDWANFINDYLTQRENLMNLFVLLDSRLEPQKLDIEFMEFCATNAIPFSMVFTKIDKLTKNKLESNIAHYKKVMLESWEELPQIFLTSSTSKEGTNDLLKYIESINKMF